ncbi:MAG: SEL1-like repeat protein [Prevotella sp.]|nr:SEL1-like repeat protein [Prevotella sp.]
MRIISIAIFLSLTLMAGAQKKPVKQDNVTKTDSLTSVVKKAEKGDALAQNTLGTWYYTGKYVKKNYDEALKWWAKSAKQENTDAIANMAMCYQLGRGIKRDSIMAVKLYKASVQKGNKFIIPQHESIANKTGDTFSSRMLYEFYMNGIGVKQDKAKAIHYLEKVAKKGDTDSQFRLALYYLNNKQADVAAEWFKKASDGGVVGASYYYGLLLHEGVGIKQDKAKGIILMEQAAKKGFAASYYQLGKIYYEGNGIEKDYTKATWYLKKATFTNADARWLLGICYLRGWGVPQDYYIATQWLANAGTSHTEEISTLLKEESVYAQYVFGLKEYIIGKNYKVALEHFKKVSKANIAEGETMTGVVLSDSSYSNNNIKKAAKIFEKVIDGSSVANYYLSEMYELGTGVEKNNERAMLLLEKAASNGIAIAQCKLGDKFMIGQDVIQDYAKAVELYLQAERQQQLTSSAASNLAKCYEMKIGNLPDLKNAEKRIAQLKRYKPNDYLMFFLRKIE